MRKLRKQIIVTILFVISVYFTNQVTLMNTNNMQNDIGAGALADNADTNISNNYTKAYVSRVVDGDTIEVVIESKKYKVRLIGMNCPEYTSKIEYYGKESTEYTTSALNNKYVYLEKDVSETDKYGRLLRYVWLEIPNQVTLDEMKNKMFNAVLVINGYANQATYPPDIKYSKQFKELATEARTSNRGLWEKE